MCKAILLFTPFRQTLLIMAELQNTMFTIYSVTKFCRAPTQHFWPRSQGNALSLSADRRSLDQEITQAIGVVTTPQNGITWCSPSHKRCRSPFSGFLCLVSMPAVSMGTLTKNSAIAGCSY